MWDQHVSSSGVLNFPSAQDSRGFQRLRKRYTGQRQKDYRGQVSTDMRIVAKDKKTPRGMVSVLFRRPRIIRGTQ